MAEFILVHGSWHGAWCWNEVVRRLEERGHTVAAIDLPGHGQDRTPPEAVTLENYLACIGQAIDCPRRPILVGHSMGGLIGPVAERVPERVRALIFVSALLPPGGSSMMDLVSGFDPRYLAQLEWAPDRRTARLSLAGVRDFFYNCCPANVAETAFPLLTPEPAAPFETRIPITGADSDTVPRYYVECLRDRVVPIALQRAMCAGARIQGVYSLDTDHAPFFSAPERLAAILDEIAGKV